MQESVNDVLRLHPIKPHWMFALDNLVRSCIQAAITVLTPELSEHIANSSPSTVNSSKSSKTNEGFEVKDTSLQLRNENIRLSQELLECQRQYQGLVSIYSLWKCFGLTPQLQKSCICRHVAF